MAWHAKPLLGYTRDSTEAIDNATEIKNFLTNQGWTLNAICAMLGNIGYEGSYNPWRWENDWRDGEAAIMTKEFSYTYDGYNHGYGMFGFTPSKRYTNTVSETYSGYAPNFADQPGNASDGNAQLIWVTQNPSQFDYPASYSPYPASTWTYSHFIESTTNPQYLADVWMCNWEKPAEAQANQTRAGRKNEAQYWWDYFEGGPTPPDPPIPPKPIRKRKFKWWMYMPMPF